MKKNFSSLLVFFISLPFLSMAQLCYQNSVIYPVGTYQNANSINNADFNGDGILDLVCTTYNNPYLGINIGTGTGSFSAATFFTVGTNPMSVAVADFNNDGKKDVVTANNGSNNISVLIGSGTGSFSAATNFTVGTQPYTVIAADFNNDGKEDVATANFSSNNITVRLGNGTGGFGAATSVAVGTGPTFLVSADFNADGKKDIVVSNRNANTVSYLAGNGTGGFSTAVNYSVGSQPMVVTTGDFNNDGKMDLATANEGNNTLSILIGNGNGTFAAATSVSTGAALGTTLHFITNADMNGDGKVDLITSNAFSNSYVSVFLGNGTGVFASPANFTIGGNDYLYEVTCGDFNSDSKMDMAVPCYTSSGHAVFLGKVDFTISKTDVTCNGLNNGTATVTPTCGLAPYSYSWSTTPVQTTATASNLSPGSYSVTMTDADNATKTLTVTITQPNVLNVTITKNNVTCTGANNGQATAGPYGGTSPYTYSWSTGQTTQSISNLSPGTYTVNVGDNKGCTVSNSVIITQPTPFVANATTTDVSCYGGNNGTATGSASGGTTPYIYTWSNTMNTGPSTSGLSAGVYWVRARDNQGCTGTYTFTIAQPSALTVTPTKTDVSCYNGNNGSATANPAGGTSPYTYSWSTSPIQTTPTATNLTAGTFTIKVTDSKGCIKTSTVGIGMPQQLTATTTTTSLNCFGDNNGSSTVTPGGGTSPYTYQWNTSPSQTTATASGLTAGTYTVTVTDSKGCVKTASSIVTSPPALNVSTTPYNANCNGSSTGSAGSTVSGGTAPYNYTWSTSPVQTTMSATSLAAGTYTLTVRDGKNCIKTATAIIGQPAPINISFNIIPVSCNGGMNGSATANTTGGTTPYYYSWTPNVSGQATAIASSLYAGTYTLQVRDGNNCMKSETVVVTEPPVLNATVQKTDVSCFGGNNGSATVTATGGNGNYTYSWSTSPVQTTATATSLSAGTYTIRVTDQKGCLKQLSTSITAPAVLSVTFNQTPASCYAVNDATLTAIPAGGTSPYSYSWSTTPSQTGSTATGLYAGTYQVTITDSKGCTKNASGLTTQPNLLQGAISVSANTSCSGSCNGTASLSVTGGNSPYTYLWGQSTNNQTTSIASNLCEGYYEVQITDAKQCTTTSGSFVPTESAVNAEVFLTNLAAVDQNNVSPSFAAYYSYSLPATINPPASNPRNFVDPGKRARFKVECTNQKNNGSSIVSGICKVRTNDPYFSITDSSSALNNIGWNNFAWSADEFEINISPNIPVGHSAYIDFVVQENGLNYKTTCVEIPVHPLIYSQTTPFTIDDDNNPDSQGNDNEICESGEIIEFYPWLNSVSKLDAEYVRGKLENLDNLSYINIWDNVPGVGTQVYNSTWWNYAFGAPQTVNAYSFETKPEFDFVFNYNNPSLVQDFKLYLVMAGGFKLFSGTALSLVQWSSPFIFNSSGVITDTKRESTSSLRVFPNPNSGDILNFDLNGEFINEVKLFNSIGELVRSSLVQQKQIDVSGLAPGVYQIQVMAGGKLHSERIVIK